MNLRAQYLRPGTVGMESDALYGALLCISSESSEQWFLQKQIQITKPVCEDQHTETHRSAYPL